MTFTQRFLPLALLASLPSGAVLAQNITEPTTGRNIGIVCAACHGTDGISHGSVPTIKGRSAEELEARLQAYRADKEKGTIMNRIAKGYTDAEITAVSDYFGSMR